MTWRATSARSHHSTAAMSSGHRMRSPARGTGGSDAAAVALAHTATLPSVRTSWTSVTSTPAVL